jgi:glycosyltransferase involved in cell wall biosynthesis
MYNILFVATYPDQPIGYSKIANRLSNYLANIPDVKVYYFGFANFDRTRIKGRYIHPDITFIDVVAEEKRRGHEDELYGVNVLLETLLQLKPQMLFIYNDIIVTSRLINVIIDYRKKYVQKFLVYCYVDLVYDYEKPLYINHILNNSHFIFTFSEHWKKNLLSMGGDPNKIDVLYHGFNKDIFSILDKYELRKESGLKQDDFLILNLNRNSYRKAQDITVRAYLILMKKLGYPTNVKLFLQCDISSKTGYDIYDLVDIESKRLDIPALTANNIKTNQIMQLNLPINKISDDVINKIYNICDVGINTCIGEGFGLCNLEQACLGKPQVISKVGALEDIFEDYPSELLIEPVGSFYISPHTDGHVGLCYLVTAEQCAEGLLKIYSNYNYYSNIAKEFGEKLIKKYDWDLIEQKLVANIKDRMSSE